MAKAASIPIRLVAIAVAVALVAAMPFVRAASVQQDQTVDLELVLAVDVSGSVDEFEARLQRDGYVTAFVDPVVVNAVRSGPLGRIAVAYFEWAGFGHAIKTVDWVILSSAEDAQAFAARLDAAPLARGRFTSISGAIGYALTLFPNNGFEGSRRVIDISGDGPNNSGPVVNFVCDEALANDITINGLPIINQRPQPFGLPQMPDLDLYFENCVIGGPGAFIVVADTFQDFGSAIRRKLILEIAGLAAPPRLEPQRPNRVMAGPRGPVPRAVFGTRPDRVRPVADLLPPDCLIGERMLQQFRFDRFEFP